MNPPPDDTALLLRYLRGGDHAAFAELMRHHLPVVYTVALRVTGNAEMAADVSQDVFLKLARNPTPVMKGVPLAAWLHRSTRHRALDILRSERSRQARERTAIPEEPAEEMPPEIIGMLDEVIDSLPAVDRALVIQRFISGESFSSISARSGTTEDATRMRVNRALEKMRKLFASRGVKSTAALLAGTLQAQAARSVTPPAHLAAGILTAARAITPVSSGLLPLILMTTTQKLIIGATVLALAAVTVAVSTRGTTTNPTPVSSATGTAETSAQQDAASPSATPEAPAATRSTNPAGRNAIPGEFAAMEKTYGAARTRRAIALAHRATESAARMSRVELGDPEASKRWITDMSFNMLKRALGLDEEQKKSLDLLADGLVEDLGERIREYLKNPAADRVDTVETLLAADAFAAEKITREEFDAILARTGKAHLDGKVTTLKEAQLISSEPIDPGPDEESSLEWDPFIRTPEIAEKFAALLSPAQLERYREFQQRDRNSKVKFEVPHHGMTLEDVADFMNYGEKLEQLFTE